MIWYNYAISFRDYEKETVNYDLDKDDINKGKKINEQTNLLSTIVLKNDNLLWYKDINSHHGNDGEIDKLTYHNVQLNCIFLSFELSSCKYLLFQNNY